MKEGDTFVSHSNNTSHCLRGNITFSTSKVIIVISCRVCEIQYVGETRTSLKRRFYGHRSTVNTKKLDTPVGLHFNLPNHSITDMILQGIESLGTQPDTVHASREKMWMRRLHTTQPHGLNIHERNNSFSYFIFQHISFHMSRPILYYSLLLFVLFPVCSLCVVLFLVLPFFSTFSHLPFFPFYISLCPPFCLCIYSLFLYFLTQVLWGGGGALNFFSGRGVRPRFPKWACELIFASERGGCELKISKFGGL